MSSNGARGLGFCLGWLVVVTLPGTLACVPVEETPVEALGDFGVEGRLAENACAPGFDPAHPLSFVVTLGRSGGSLRWRIGGGAPVSGSLRSNGAFDLRSTTLVEAWPADPATGIVGCTLTQTETISGTLRGIDSGDGGYVDAGIPEDASQGDGGVGGRASFEATHRIQIAPASGSDCTALLTSVGGSFPSFPCSARYELIGVAR